MGFLTLAMVVLPVAAGLQDGQSVERPRATARAGSRVRVSVIPGAVWEPVDLPRVRLGLRATPLGIAAGVSLRF